MKGVQIRFYNDSTEGKMLSRKGARIRIIKNQKARINISASYGK